jgi:hypothetical protein
MDLWPGWGLPVLLSAAAALMLGGLALSFARRGRP